MSSKNTMIAIFAVFVIALMLSPNKEEKQGAPWSYTEDLGPQHWSTLDEKYSMCSNGLAQSPINITNTIQSNLPQMVLKNTTKASNFENNGHTIQVSFKKGNTLSLNNKTYTLKQMHFHTPSENQINSKSYPMEAHLVHSSKKGELLVLALMFEYGEENIMINQLLRNLPKMQNDNYKLKSDIYVYKILPKNKGYYSFTGSLTTPPCSEGVTWLVLKDAVNISKSQLKDFGEVMLINNRPLQKINSRYILEVF